MNQVKQLKLGDAHVFPRDKTFVIVDKEELDMLELNNDMAGGIFQEIREVIEAQPCFHGVLKGSAPMFFAEHIMCIRNFAIKTTYEEIIKILQGEEMNVAANLVSDLLSERMRNDAQKEKEEKKEDDVEETNEDRNKRE